MGSQACAAAEPASGIAFLHSHHLWYGFPRDGSAIANFGEVYTEPEHRRKGVTTLLMEDFAADFAEGSAVAAFCNCGRLHVAKLYMAEGFRYALPNNAYGALALIWLRLAREQGIDRVFAYSSATDESRLDGLESAGFRECARLPGACVSRKAVVDEVVHVLAENSP